MEKGDDRIQEPLVHFRAAPFLALSSSQTIKLFLPLREIKRGVPVSFRLGWHVKSILFDSLTFRKQRQRVDYKSRASRHYRDDT